MLVESALLKEVHLHVWESEPKSRSVNEVEDRRREVGEGDMFRMRSESTPLSGISRQGDTDLGNSTFKPLTAGENGESVCMLLRGVAAATEGGA